MSARLKIDYSEFQTALREYQKATQKDAALILNKFGADVALHAIRMTPKASTTAKGTGKYNPAKKGYEARLYYAKGAHAAPVGERKKAAEKSYNRARSSVGFMRAGWINAAKNLGKQVRGRPFPGGAADKGYGLKAKASRLIASIFNFADGADIMGAEALQKAVKVVAARELAYAKRKLQQTATKYSGRKR